MEREDRLRERLQRLGRRTSQFRDMVEKQLDENEAEFRILLKEWEVEASESREEIRIKEEQLKSDTERAGSEFAKKKYLLERDATGNRSEIQKLEEDMKKTRDHFQTESTNLNELKSKTEASFERQKRAMKDLFEEQNRNYIVTRGNLTRKYQAAESTLREHKKRHQTDLDQIISKNQETLNGMQKDRQSKEEGWNLAMATLKKQIDALEIEKSDLQGKLSNLRSETEQELKSIRTSMNLSKEQLEIDKATIKEKADEDQKNCERELSQLNHKINNAEKELQDLIINKEAKVKDEEENFTREEEVLKDTVRAESEKRDYEQKLYEQQRNVLEKDLGKVKEEYDKKKWYWDNQIRNLTMQKSVQEAEHDADKMRTDRQARAILKGLETKRDEVKQRLAEIKSRHKSLVGHENKERDLRDQRWNWRKDRLWSMWQNRLEILKKERVVLQEKTRELEKKFHHENDFIKSEGTRETKRAEDLQQYILHSKERGHGVRKQKEIQLELEKTRLLAQVKECENLIVDWQNRLKRTQDQIDQEGGAFRDQLAFLDRLYQDEEKESELFLHYFQKIVSAIELKLNSVSASQDAA